jgi:hypothetical protein
MLLIEFGVITDNKAAAFIFVNHNVIRTIVPKPFQMSVALISDT